MSMRTFKYITIRTSTGTTPQPLVGAWLTAAPVFLDTGLYKLPVNDTSPFQVGDWVKLQTPTATNFDEGLVQKIVDSTNINVAQLNAAVTRTGGAFGTGDHVSLAIPCQSIYVQLVDGGTGNLYLGTAPNFNITTGVNMIQKLAKVAGGSQPIETLIQKSGYPNVDNVGQLFIAGDSNTDKYLPTVGLV